MPELFALLQGGFVVSGIRPGRSLMSFLTEQIGLSREYIQGHISTIFLDGMPVDDPDTAVIMNGSRLALSAALPGLVGATMRQGGVLASLRNSITYRASGKESADSTGAEGILYLKLFNIVMQELGPSLLEKGILVDTCELKEFLDEHHDLLLKCRRIFLDCHSVGPDEVVIEDAFRGFDLVRLSVKTIDGE